jgi:hypothetical protein
MTDLKGFEVFYQSRRKRLLEGIAKVLATDAAAQVIAQ